MSLMLLSIIKQSRSLASLCQEHHRIYRVFTNYPSLPGLEGGNKAHPGVSHYLRFSPRKGQEADITSKGNISLPLLLSPSLQHPCLQPPTGTKVAAIPGWGHRARLMPSEVIQLQQVTNLYPFGIPLPGGGGGGGREDATKAQTMDPDGNPKQPQQSRHPLKLGEIPSLKGYPQGCRSSSETWVRRSQHFQRQQMCSVIILWAQKKLSDSLRAHGSRAHGGQRRESTLGQGRARL